MEDNKNFNVELNLSYLCLLMEHNHDDEFIKRFDSISTELSGLADESLEFDVLSKLRSVIDYKKSLSLKGEMIR